MKYVSVWFSCWCDALTVATVDTAQRSYWPLVNDIVTLPHHHQIAFAHHIILGLLPLVSRSVTCIPIPFHAVSLQGGPKNLAPFFLYALTLPNINRFSKLFHGQNQKKICSDTVAKDPTTPQVCHYTTLWNVNVIKATTENKTTSATTHFKKLTTGNNVFIAWIIVKSNCHILQVFKYSMCPPCCWTTHSSRRRHWPMARSMKIS